MNESLLKALDNFFISFYRISPDPIANFFWGTLLISFFSLMVGEFTFLCTLKMNRSHLDKIKGALERNYSLSLHAFKENNREDYKTFNNLANDAFGRFFFNMMALSASRLWPVFFALGWMQWRFQGLSLPLGLQLPLLGNSVGYVLIFFLSYICSYTIFKFIKGMPILNK